MPFTDLTNLGAFGGGAAGVGLAVKYVTDAVRHRGSRKRDETTTTITDAATANEAMRATLGEHRAALLAERADNREKDKRIDMLERRCESLGKQLLDQRAEYDQRIRAAREDADRQIRDMQERVNELTFQLSELRRHIGTEGTS